MIFKIESKNILFMVNLNYFDSEKYILYLLMHNIIFYKIEFIFYSLLIILLIDGLFDWFLNILSLNNLILD